MTKVLELQLLHQSFQQIFRVDFPYSWLVWSPCCPGDFQESSQPLQFEGINSLVFFFTVQLSQPYVTTRKTIALTIWTFVRRIMSLLFNTLSRLVIAFLPRCNHLLISWLQSPSAVIFRVQEEEICHYFHLFPFYLPWSDGTGWHDLSWVFFFFFLIFSFKSALSRSSFTLIKRLFSSISLSAFRVVLSIYLRLLFLLPILISTCNSSSPAFLMMYAAFRLNKQGDSRQPCQDWIFK